MSEQYTVSIEKGKLVVVISKAKEGGYLVTSPFDPELITQGETIDEAIAMAKDASKTLAEARAKKPSLRRRGRGALVMA